MTVFTATVTSTLKKTLNLVMTDKDDGIESDSVMKKFCEVLTMEDNYEDDLDSAGPGLASEKPEGQEMATGTITEGFKWRYNARTFGLKLIVSDEAIEDSKYPEIIKAGRRLKRAMWKTVDYDATYILIRGFNTAYTYGDGVCLWSTSHPLAQGGTFSNYMATPMSPSRTALIVATTQIRKFPDYDNTIGMTMRVRNMAQRMRWRRVAAAKAWGKSNSAISPQ